MTQPASRSRWLFFAVFCLFSASLSACGASNHVWLEAPGWSRALLVGETQAEFAVNLAQDPEGNTYFLLVTEEEEGAGYNLKLVKLDANAGRVWEQEYALNVEQDVENPRVFWTHGALQLLWVESDVLYSLSVNADGEQLGEPAVLSNGYLASSYEATIDPRGELVLMYSGLRSHPGLYLQTDDGAQLLDEGGYAPQMEFDAQGGLHVSWLHGMSGSIQRDIYYAYFADGVYAPGNERIIYSIRIPITSTMAGYGMGLDNTHTYIFWSELTRTGLGAGGVDAKYLAFAYEPEGALVEEPLYFPNGYGLLYTPADGPLLGGDRAQLEDQDSGRTSGLTELSPTQGSNGELALAFKSRLPYLRNKTAQQVGLLFLNGGEQVGGQLLSFNSTTSERPAVLVDEQSYLHATFLGGGYPPFQVYYASTSPTVVAALNQLDNEDYGRLAADTSFGIVSGLLLIPFILAFGLLPTLFLFFTGSFRREGEWILARGTAITLFISLVLYWLSKLAILPGIVDYVPFTAWIPDIPTALQVVLRYSVPVFATLLALFVAYWFTYARERMQPLFFLLIFILVDGFITIAIYGVIFYSAI